MLYQLPNGKVIEMSTEQYVEASDEEFEYLLAFNYGESLENPWFGSIISSGKNYDDVFSGTEDTSSSPLPDLIEIPDEQKLEDLDVDRNYMDE